MMYDANYYLLDAEQASTKLPSRHLGGSSRHRSIEKARQTYDPISGSWLVVQNKAEAVHYVAEGGRWSFVQRAIREST